MIQKIQFILLLIFLVGYNYAQSTINGCVYLKDSTIEPARHTMVYLPQHKFAVMTDEAGEYSIDIKDNFIKNDSIELEFSYIGYKTESRKVKFNESTATFRLDTVILEVQPVMITAAYIIPKGQTAAEYIISQVWKQSEKNRKLLNNYAAAVSYNLASHEIPIVSKVMPGTMLGVGKIFAKINGFGPIVKLCLENDDVDVTAEFNRHIINGNRIDTDHRITQSNIKIPSKVENNLIEIFNRFDLFSMLYGYKSSWVRKFTKHHKFELIGTYEYNDKLIDVLKWDSGGRLNIIAHIVEDNWGILKIQINFGKEAARIEARDIGGGIYMPVNMVISPQVTLIKANDIPKAIAKIRSMKSISRKTANRAIKLLESRAGQDFNPYITIGYNIYYDTTNYQE